MPTKRDLMPGTLDMLILKILTRSPQHGYGIALSIKRVSEDFLTVEEGSLYPALQRLNAARLGEGGMEENRDEPASALLFADSSRAQNSWD